MNYHFQLRDVFVWTTVLCVGLAIERAFGAFLLSLLLGLVTISFGLWLVKLDSILLGAIVGFGAALLLYNVACWVNSSSYDLVGYTAGCFFYLAAGLAVGLVTAADRSIRHAL